MLSISLLGGGSDAGFVRLRRTTKEGPTFYFPYSAAIPSTARRPSCWSRKDSLGGGVQKMFRRDTGLLMSAPADDTLEWERPPGLPRAGASPRDDGRRRADLVAAGVGLLVVPSFLVVAFISPQRLSPPVRCLTPRMRASPWSCPRIGPPTCLEEFSVCARPHRQQFWGRAATPTAEPRPNTPRPRSPMTGASSKSVRCANSGRAPKQSGGNDVGFPLDRLACATAQRDNPWAPLPGSLLMVASWGFREAFRRRWSPRCFATWHAAGPACRVRAQ